MICRLEVMAVLLSRVFIYTAYDKNLLLSIL